MFIQCRRRWRRQNFGVRRARSDPAHTTSSVGPTSVSTLRACRKQHVLTVFFFSFSLFPRAERALFFSLPPPGPRVVLHSPTLTSRARSINQNKWNQLPLPPPSPLAKQINTAEPTPSSPPPPPPPLTVIRVQIRRALACIIMHRYVYICIIIISTHASAQRPSITHV